MLKLLYSASYHHQRAAGVDDGSDDDDNSKDADSDYDYHHEYDFVYDQQADIDCGDFLGGVWDGDGDGPGTCNEFPLVYDGGSTVVLIISESGCFNFQIGFLSR